MRAHLLCLGFGYAARRLGRLACFEGMQVSGTSRSAENAVRLAAAFPGIDVHAWPKNGFYPADTFNSVTHLLISAPPGPGGDPVLPWLPPLTSSSRLRWVGYLSTVGVYGDSGGAWVDEDTPPHPAQVRSALRLKAEQAWRDWGIDHGVTVQVFRLPGIYGPGRSAFDPLRAGTARHIVREGQVFSRIHVDDIAGAVLHILDRSDLQSIPVINLVDDEPASAASVLLHACSLLKIVPPPEERFERVEAELSPMAAGFWSESRRVSNRRLRTAIGYGLRYPTYRQGLAAILAEEAQDKAPKGNDGSRQKRSALSSA